jgi:hypothetical protein
MNTTSTGKRSPLHAWHTSHCDNWCQLGETPLPRQFAAADEEQSAAGQLALCDLSGLPLLEVKGSGAVDWLTTRNLPVPAAIYEGKSTGEGGWITRTGSAEFLLRGPAGGSLPGLSGSDSAGEVLITHRQDAIFLVAGNRIGELMAQTCGLDYASLPARQTLFSRVAGISCGMIKDQLNGIPVCWLWLDPSYALYLWEQLVQITTDLDGKIVGVSCFYPDIA